MTNINNYPLVDLYTNYMMIISRSLRMKQGYQLIASKYHMSYQIMSVDFVNFSQNLINLGINQEIIIYRILSAQKYQTLTESEKKTQGYNYSENIKTQFAIATLNLSQLFDLSFFHEYILKCNEIELSRNIIFIFEDIRYLDLLAALKTHNITISGGSNKFQHILTPIRFRLSQIIACLENGRKQGVSQSFHIPNKLETYGGNILLESTKPNLNWIALDINKNKKPSN